MAGTAPRRTAGFRPAQDCGRRSVTALLSMTIALAGASVATARAAAAAAPIRATTAAAPSSNSAPGTYRPLVAARVLDTRTGLGAPARPVVAHGVAVLAVLGRGGLPASGVAAVVLNVTATNEAAHGYLTVFPGGASRPATSAINFAPGNSTANSVTVAVGATGAVDIYNGSAGQLDLVADVQGYFLSGSAAVAGAFIPVGPARLLDTRLNSPPGVPGRGVRRLTVAGRGGVPATGVSAVLLNVHGDRRGGGR